MIKNLVFDFGNVLVDYDFDLFLSGFIPEAEARKRFAEIVCDPAIVDRFDKGDSTRRLRPFAIDSSKQSPARWQVCARS